MNPSHGIRAAVVAAVVIASAGCVENSYRARNSDAVVVHEAAPAGSPDAGTPAAPAPSGPSGDAPAVAHRGPVGSDGYAVPGFHVQEEDGRLWVFKRGSADHASFELKGEPAKRVTLIAAGPDGKTLLGADKAVLEDFAASHKYAAPGFVVIGDEGRLWVFRRGSEDLASFIAKGEPAKRVTLIAAGPDGKTLLGADKAAMQDYAAAVAN